VSGTTSELDLTEQELTQVEPDGCSAPEGEVDQDDAVVVPCDEQVVGAGVAVRGRGG
jgi:hypothetical protein